MKKTVFIYCPILLCLIILAGKLTAQDITPPEKPILTYVTVDTATSNVIIHWVKSTSPDVKSYILYRRVKTGNPLDQGVPIDTVAGSSTSYTHVNTGLATHESILYSVSAIDTAGNISTRTAVHGTIHNSISYDSCNSTLTLRWNRYQGWGNNVSGYRIFSKMKSVEFQIIAGINATDSSFIIYEVPENTNYSFFIEGVKNDSLISSSNIASKYTYMPLPPEELITDYINVTGSRTVELKFRFTDTSQIRNYALLRSDQEFSEFTRIKSYINLSSAVQIVSDSFFTSVSRYFYRIGALNSCGAVIDTSNLATNILLEGQNDGESNILHWNSYRNFPLGLSGYEIYRLDTAASAELIGTTAGQCTFTDNLTSIYGQNFSGKINYLIKAIENGGANYSFSNYCPVNAKSEIWMPNAFTPNGDGKNDVLLPRLNFIPENYLMLIYDRFGIVAFTSKSPDIGWDGRIGGGKFAPEGVYVVHIQYSSFNGQKINKTESVSVFYPR